MNRKITYGLLLLTGVALFIAPQVARLNIIMPAPAFGLFLIPGLWLILVIMTMSKPEKMMIVEKS